MALLLSGRIGRACKEPLQGPGLDARLAKLAGGAGGRGEALDRVAVTFGRAANDGECRCFARAGVALHTLNTVGRVETRFLRRVVVCVCILAPHSL